MKYLDYISSLIIDNLMSSEPLPKYRKKILKDAYGEVLEIGFGTGINIDYYPEHIEKITIVEPNKEFNKIAEKRIKKSRIKIDQRILGGEDLPFKDSTFDTVVSTWSLCSILDVNKALNEIYRVLKSDEKFIFIEHGLAPDRNVRKLQSLITPFSKCLFSGCHMNRDIKDLIKNSSFNFLELNEFYMEETPRFDGYTYQGIAIK